jgi:hypothetical protein
VLPAFWLDTGDLHANVAQKLCLEMIVVLKDIGADTLPSAESETEPFFDYGGVDFLADTLLGGIFSWLGKLDCNAWALQPWYSSWCGVVTLLRW